MKKFLSILTLLLAVCSGALATETTLINFPSSKNGITVGGTTLADQSITVNGTSYSAYQFKNSWSSGANYLKLETAGGFKASDVLTIAGAISSGSKTATAFLYEATTSTTA